MSITYLEFYSGIGGWTFALRKSIDILNKSIPDGGTSSAPAAADADVRPDDASPCSSTPQRHILSMERLDAYDHSDLCNKVMSYNFPEGNIDDHEIKEKQRFRKKRKTSTNARKTVAIESLTRRQLEEMSAFIWMMSPPCQPHTRQHSNQEEDVNDPRSKSFLHLCDMISTMEGRTLPKIILMENVVGFENSNSCRLWRKALRSRNYSVSHFHLNPTQFSIPNDRPRYYAIAILMEDPVPLENFDAIKHTNIDNSAINKWFDGVREKDTDNLDECPPIQKNIHLFAEKTDDKGLLEISNFLEGKNEEHSELYVPEKLLKSNSSWCFDTVTPTDKRSACFTSSYGRFVRGTGSVILQNLDKMTLEKFQLVSPEDRNFDSEWASEIKHGDLRYFSGRELARLFGFPVESEKYSSKESSQSLSFQFPPDCSLKQQWKLMGNSLNVCVAAKICEVALRLVLFGSASSNSD